MYRLIENQLQARLYDPDSLRALDRVCVLQSLREGECEIYGSGESHENVHFNGERFRKFSPKRELDFRVEICVSRHHGSCDQHVDWISINTKAEWSFLVWPFILDADIRDDKMFHWSLRGGVQQTPIIKEKYLVCFMFSSLSDAYLFKIRFSDDMYIPD